MGSIIGASCDCGYEKSEMFLGGGMANFNTYCNFPHYCEDCRTLFEADLFDKSRSCPRCKKRNVIAYDDERACKIEGKNVFSWNVQEEIGRNLNLTDGSYICPACGKFNLTFFDIGCWD